MCGRYAFFSIKDIKDRFGVENVQIDPSYNIAPGTINPIITRNSPNKLTFAKWGLIPFWSKDPKIGYKMINARRETVATAPSFSEPFKSKRCLIPANGFYEWKRVTEKEKYPYYIEMKDEEVLSFAGLYDVWKDPEGKEITTYTIITTSPNDLMKDIHNRMPVILKRDDEDKWLDKDSAPGVLIGMLKPIEPKYLEAYQVSSKVNSPRNNSEDLIKRA